MGGIAVTGSNTTVRTEEVDECPVHWTVPTAWSALVDADPVFDSDHHGLLRMRTRALQLFTNKPSP